MTEKLLKRLQKLKALADCNTVPQESTAAFEKLAKLMQENNLTETDLKDASIEDALGPLCNDDTIELKRYRAYNSLVQSLARYYYCDGYSYTHYSVGLKGTLKVRLFGRKGQIETVKIMYTYIVEFCDKYAKKQGYTNTQKLNFIFGVAKKIALMQHKENNDTKGTAIAIVNEAKNYMLNCLKDSGHTVQTSKVKIPCAYRNAYSAGLNANFSLARQAGNNSTLAIGRK